MYWRKVLGDDDQKMGRYYTLVTDKGEHSCNHKFWFGIQNSDAAQRWMRDGCHTDIYSCPMAEPDAFGSAGRWDGEDWPNWSERGDWNEETKKWSGFDDDDNAIYDDHKHCYEMGGPFCQPTGLYYRFELEEVPWIKEQIDLVYATFNPSARAYVDYCQLEAMSCYSEEAPNNVSDDKEWERLSNAVDSSYPDATSDGVSRSQVWSDMADWVLGRHLVALMSHYDCGLDVDCEI